MRAVKFFVVFGAVVLLAGLGALLSRLHERASGTGTPTPTAEATPQEESLALPTGARVAQLAGLDGSGAAVLVTMPDGGGQVLFFSAQGRLKRRVTLETLPREGPAAPRIPGN
ncbi:MAG: hypothetical protein HQL95_13970 [Magnetococcales bacterium]|nr:hypothetical protein [Magnetococcales bacterium]